MAVNPVGALSAVPFTPASLSSTSRPQGIGDAFAKGLRAAQGAQDTAGALGNQLATGTLTDVHEFTVAAAKASLSVQLTAALRNRAVDAYQEIMRMQV